MQARRPNNRPDNCYRCGGRVEAGAGFLGGRVGGRWTVVHAEGGCLAQPVPVVAEVERNRYPGNCARCGGRVEVGAGIRQPVDGRWSTLHEGDCPTADPEARTAPAGKRQPYPPTAEQAAAIAKLDGGAQAVTIQAGAGAGKTSLLLFIAEWMEANGLTGAYRAFNRQIVDDTATKMLGNVNCETMHSDALNALPHYRARLNSTNNRQSGAEQAHLLGIEAQVIYVGEERRRLAAGWIAARVMRAVRKYCLSADEDLTRRHIDYIDGIDPHDAAGNRTYANNDRLRDYMLPFARKAWIDLISERGDLRFTHDVYLKVWSLGDPDIAGDVVMVDEGQDTDAVQMVVFRKLAAKGKRIVVVGDEQQTLYDWRGAVDALAAFEAGGAEVCFLTQSFRFGDSIAEVANGLLERLGARLRLRGHGPVASTVGAVPEPDAILCRSNAGTIRALIEQAAAGRAACLYGRNQDIVSFMKGALRLQDGRSTTNPELACFDSWAAVQAYVAEEPEGEDIKLLVKLVDEFGAQRILDNIEHQPKAHDADVVISTVHKTKGLEWPRVKLYPDFRAPADGGELSVAELRTAYVACTRASQALDITDTPHLAVGWRPAP